MAELMTALTDTILVTGIALTALLVYAAIAPGAAARRVALRDA
jgi:hypothetical protein